MKKQGETELLKGQSPTPKEQIQATSGQTTALSDQAVHFFLTLYQASETLPEWIEPALFVWNLICVTASHVELGTTLIVGTPDSVFLSYFIQTFCAWAVFGLGLFVFRNESANLSLISLLPSYKVSLSRQMYLLALGIKLQTYLFTPRLVAIFLLLLVKPELIWPGVTGDDYYWLHLGVTWISTLVTSAITYVFFCYCKLPLPGNRHFFSSNSVINQIVMMIFPLYAFLATVLTKQLFILRRSHPFLVIVIHMFKSTPAYLAIASNLTNVTFYNRAARDVLVWAYMLTLTAWGMVVFIYDVSPKHDRFLALMMCLLAPIFITTLVRVGKALDGRITNSPKLSAVISLAEISLLVASDKLHSLEDRKSEYLKNYYFHQEKVKRIVCSIPKKLSEPEKLIIAVFENLINRNRAKSFLITTFFIHYLTKIDSGVLLPIKLVKKLSAELPKRSLRDKVLFRVIIQDLQAKLDSVAIQQELLKVGKTDFSSLDCSPVNPHLSLIQVPVGFYGRRNLDALVLFDRLAENMQQQMKTLKEFYSSLSKSECEVSSLHKQAIKIHEGQTRCQKIFDLLDAASPLVNTFHLLPYAMFAHHTNNNNRLMKEILHQFHLRKKAKLHPRMNLPFLGIKDSSSFLVSSAEPTEIGEIVYAGGQSQQLMHGSDHKNIFELLPDGMQAHHKVAINTYLTELERPYLGVKLDRILRTPGTCFYSQHQMVTLFASSLNSGLQFVTCVEEGLHSNEFLLFDSSLKVCGFSQKFKETEPRIMNALLKKPADQISNQLVSLMVGNEHQQYLEPIEKQSSKVTVSSYTGTTASNPSEVSAVIPVLMNSPMIKDGDLMFSITAGLQVPCKIKDITVKVLAINCFSRSTPKSAHYQVNLPSDVLRTLKRTQGKHPRPHSHNHPEHYQPYLQRVPIGSGPTLTPNKPPNNPRVTGGPRRTPTDKLRTVVTTVLFVSRLKQSFGNLRKLMSPNSESRDAESFEFEEAQLNNRNNGSKRDKDALSERLLARLDSKFAKPCKEDIEAADSVNTHRQIMYDSKSLTIKDISPKAIILWALLGLGAVISLFWAGMIYCYYLEIIYMGGKAATLLDARLVQSMLVKSRWSVWQMIDGVVEKMSTDNKYTTADRFNLIGIPITRDWKQVYLEGAKRWPRDQNSYLLHVEKLPETSIDTINMFVYKTNISLGGASSNYITKSLTLSNILYFVSFQVRMLYQSLPKVNFTTADYAKAISLIEDGSPATVSKYADQIVIVEGNKFAEILKQISTTVLVIMLVSEGFALCITVLLWLMCDRIADVYQTFTLLEDREIQFKKDRLEHFERSLKTFRLDSETLLIMKEVAEPKLLGQKNILSKRSKQLRRAGWHSFGLGWQFLPLFLFLQISLYVVFNLAGKIVVMLEVQNETTTNFRSFGKMMYQHRAAYHMIFEAVLVKAGVGKNVTITAQLTKLNNIINNMKSFQSEMERFYRANKLSDTGKKFAHIPMIFDPCGTVSLTNIGITQEMCIKLADGTLAQDFMSVMNWAISVSDNFLNTIRSAPKEKALLLLSHQQFLNLEFLVKKFYYPFYESFADRFKQSMKEDQMVINSQGGVLAVNVLIIMGACSVLFGMVGSRFSWHVSSVALNILKYLPSISLIHNAHLKLKLKKYNPKYA